MKIWSPKVSFRRLWRVSSETADPAEQPSPKKEEEMFQADEDGKGPKIKTEEQAGAELFQAQHSLS